MKYELIRDDNGKHQIGGDVPENFKIPNNEFIAGFQYLGFVDNIDEIFSWLPFKVNLIHPIYCDTYSVYLDYNNPNAPTIIEPIDTGSETTAYDELTVDSEVIFETVKVKLEPKSEIDEYKHIGIAGTPDWLQGAELPFCPKTKKPMKFLCQLSSFSNIKTKSTNVEPEDGYEMYFNKLNFWGDGNLYIFIERSKLG